VQVLNTILLDDIIIPDNRMRRTFDEKRLKNLADSIHSKGLLHPPVLHADGKTLLAGERRCRSLDLLRIRGESFHCNGIEYSDGRVPYLTIRDLDPILAREAELEENVIREDLSWQEKASAVAELHDLRKEQKAALGKPQTLQATASEILGRVAMGNYVTQVSEATILAKHMKTDEEVAAAPDKKSALKIIKRKAEVERRKKLAAEVGDIISEHEVIHADALQYLPHIDTDSIDIIITDPPYGVDASGFGSMADARHDYQDGMEYSLECYLGLFEHASRICRPNSFMFVFLDIRHFQTFVESFVINLLGDWSVWPTPLIWHKANGMLPVPDKGPRRNYEAILYAYRGKRDWITPGTGDVILDIPGIAKPEFGAQKPDDLYTYLLSRVYQPGDTVLDPFAGTGPVTRACSSLNCKAIAIEKDEDRFNYMLSKM